MFAIQATGRSVSLALTVALGVMAAGALLTGCRNDRRGARGGSASGA